MSDLHRFDRKNLKINSVDCESMAIELHISAELNGMNIRGSGIVLKSEFETNLPTFREFPLNERGVLISGGVWNDEGSGIDIEHIHISILTLSKSGRLIMRVKLFEEDFEYGNNGFGCGGNFDYHIDYSGLADFLDNMQSLIDGIQTGFSFSGFSDW
jgi:hypothetical protein